MGRRWRRNFSRRQRAPKVGLAGKRRIARKTDFEERLSRREGCSCFVADLLQPSCGQAVHNSALRTERDTQAPFCFTTLAKCERRASSSAAKISVKGFSLLQAELQSSACADRFGTVATKIRTAHTIAIHEQRGQGLKSRLAANCFYRISTVLECISVTPWCSR
jgi:hypothetical protein